MKSLCTPYHGVQKSNDCKLMKVQKLRNRIAKPLAGSEDAEEIKQEKRRDETLTEDERIVPDRPSECKPRRLRHLSHRKYESSPLRFKKMSTIVEVFEGPMETRDEMNTEWPNVKRPASVAPSSKTLSTVVILPEKHLNRKTNST